MQDKCELTSNNQSLINSGIGCLNDFFYHQNAQQYNYKQLFHSTVYVERSNMDKAFKIIKALMDEKMIKEDLTVKEFMNICEAISKVL